MVHYRHLHCHRCNSERRFRRRNVDHPFHLVLILCTVGIWALIWVALIFRASWQPWRCTFCGTRVRKGVPMDDLQRVQLALGFPMTPVIDRPQFRLGKLGAWVSRRSGAAKKSTLAD